MKKELLCLLTALCFIIPAVINLSACSHGNVKPGPLTSMIGTYKLTNYVTRHEDGIDVDMIKTKHAKAYIVVGDNGYGYYIYSDDDTALNCDTIKIDYTYDTETPGYVSGFSYTNGVKKLYEWEEHPGAGEEAPLHFVCGKKKKTLNYTMSEDKGSGWLKYDNHYISYYTSVDYEKVSDDTTLAYVQNQLNTTFSAMPNFKLKNLNHPMLVSFRESDLNDNYKYCVLDMDILHSKATLHYQELDDTTDQTQTIDLNISLEEFEQEYIHYSAKIQATILGIQDTFNISIDNDNIPTSYLFGSTFDIMKYWDPTKSVDEIITEKLADYNALHQD